MTNTYTVKISHQGQDHTIAVPENQTILKVAHAAGIDLPSSCNAGVCTTCAARITNGGGVAQEDGMGVSLELQQQGFVLLCVAYPRADLEIISEQEETVYQLQFGQYQK
jgi:ferredoxin